MEFVMDDAVWSLEVVRKSLFWLVWRGQSIGTVHTQRSRT